MTHLSTEAQHNNICAKQKLLEKREQKPGRVNVDAEKNKTRQFGEPVFENATCPAESEYST